MNGEKSLIKDDHSGGGETFDSWRSHSAHTQQQQQHQSQQHYSSAAMGQSASQTSDPYQMSYYPQMFPYSDASMPSSQPWSNGAEAMTFLGGYTPEHSATTGHSSHYAMEAMFGSAQNTYGFGNTMTSSHFNAFFPSNSDPFWGTTSANASQAANQSRVGLSGQNADQSQTQTQIGVKTTSGVQQLQSGGTRTTQLASNAAYHRMHDNSAIDGQPPPPPHHHHHYYDTYAASDMPLKHVESGIAGLTLDHIKASEQFSNKGHPFSSSSLSDNKKFDSMGVTSSAVVGQMPKKTTWASIASQPAKPQPKSLKSKMSSSVLTGSTSKHLPPASMEAIGTWEAKNGSAVKSPPTVVTPVSVQRQSASSSVVPSSTPSTTSSSSWANASQRQITPPSRNFTTNADNSGGNASGGGVGGGAVHPVLDKLRVENNYNPKEFDLSARSARFFIIKSYSEDDIHRSIKYSIWCSTEHGNKRLDNAFKQQEQKGPIYLLFSVNGSGHFCGMAQMMSYVDYSSSSSVWAQDKWKGQFRVKWIYVKDVPNAQLRHIRLENNENKPVTNSRDTQEVPYEKGKQVIKIMHHYRHTTSIFDDFLHYEKRQEEESQRRVDPPVGVGGGGGGPPIATPTTTTSTTATSVGAQSSSGGSVGVGAAARVGQQVGDTQKKWK